MGEDTVCYKPFFGLLHTVGEGESTIAANNTDEIKLKSATKKMYELVQVLQYNLHFTSYYYSFIIALVYLILYNSAMIKRITIDEIHGGIDINIKAHNSLFNGFVTVFVLNFVAALGMLLFMIFETAVFNKVLDVDITGIARILIILYSIFAVYMLCRSIFWTFWGKEEISINKDVFRYKKSILNIGKTVVIPIENIESIKPEYYSEPKEVIEGIKAEIGKTGKSFKISMKKGTFLFGVYLNRDELDEIEKAIHKLGYL